MPLPILLVPVTTELEWGIAPVLAETTEVATFDAPGVGSEPPPDRFDRRAIADRGLREIEDRGWDRCVVAGDEFGSVTAALMASLAPERIEALGLGHPTTSLRTGGPRAPLNRDVLEAFIGMTRTNYRAYAQAMSQVTQGAYDEAFVEEYVARVPQEVSIAYNAIHEDRDEDRLERLLADFDGPLVFAEHRGCLVYTHEGFEDAVAPYPQARTVVCTEKPSVSPGFAQALLELCVPIGAE